MLVSLSVVVTGISSCKLLGIYAFPSDCELIIRFNRNEVDFNRLIAMSDTDDNMSRIAYDFTWVKSSFQHASESEFSKERWNEYTQLFTKLGIGDGLLKPSKGNVVYLSASSRGLAIGGSSKGYAFSATPLTPEFDSLDDKAVLRENGGKYIYKKIKDNWYIFYESN